ncbi:uromodulin-like [Gastrophryne carolinensis]
MRLLERLLSKPVNQTYRIQSVNITIQANARFTKVFSLAASFMHFLVIRDYRFPLNLTDPKGKCCDVKCHVHATCEEFGGYGECTCKEGFAGNGFTCDDIDECRDYYNNNCAFLGSCVNALGSYSCNCSVGAKYDEQFGCVDINECADRAISGCHPMAVCSNYYGSYTCTCPYGYIGDGKRCEYNECQQGTPCNSDEECIKYNGSYSCTDPCSNHTVLNDPWRSTSNTNSSKYHCDKDLRGWYLFKEEHDQIPGHCVPAHSCGVECPLWLNGAHPTASDGIVKRKACANCGGKCCLWSIDISVRMCPGGSYVYKVNETPGCNMAYCTESSFSCSRIVCASDEECRMDGGVPGCHCRNVSFININNGSQTLTAHHQPQVTCDLNNIGVTLSKCLLEKLGYNSSSIHLRDTSCRGAIESRDKSYITIMARPQKGYCGAQMWYEEGVIRYENAVYLARPNEGVIIKDEQPINISCSYPLNMEIILLSGISPLTVAVPITANKTTNYTITTGLFQDSNYTIPFMGEEALINSAAMLYVGVIANGPSALSPLVLIIKNCHAASTADDHNETKIDIIREQEVHL